MKFIVDRSKWRSGGDDEMQIGLGDTYLKNSGGFMCCLGFCAKQLGHSDDEMEVGEPNELRYDSNITDILVDYDEEAGLLNSDLSREAIHINDNPRINQKEREKRLRNLFKEFGHQIVFKGKAVKP